MIIEYEVTVDDALEFNRYLLRTNPRFRRPYLLGYIAGPIVGLVLFLMTGETSPILASVMVVGSTLLFSGLYYYLYNQQVTKTVQGAYVGKAGPLGRKTMTITADGLLASDEYSDSQLKWSGIQNVQETPSAIYLFVTPIMAYIVPKRAFQPPLSPDEFLATVAKYRGVAPI